jgi:hypothetical protein
MTASVVPSPQPLQLADSSSEARKRRREILSSQRIITPDAALSTDSASSADDSTVDEEDMPTKRQRVTDVTSTKKSKPSKKPQMKYDPEVPMTKDEAAAWRREQRRKRNRESAAASRQRQRDRITELEIELDDWKDKYAEMMDKIAQLESATSQPDGKPAVTRPLTITSPSKFVSPQTSPNHSPSPSPVASPLPIISSLVVVDAVKVTPGQGSVKPIKKVEQLQEQHSNNMTSRLATVLNFITPKRMPIW